MASIDLGGTVKALKGARVRVMGDLAKLDKAIIVLEGLFRTSATTPNGHAGKRMLSDAAHRKIGNGSGPGVCGIHFKNVGYSTSASSRLFSSLISLGIRAAISSGLMGCQPSSVKCSITFQ
jgi:hypothetical protein